MGKLSAIRAAEDGLSSGLTAQNNYKLIAIKSEKK